MHSLWIAKDNASGSHTNSGNREFKNFRKRFEKTLKAFSKLAVVS